MKRLHWIFAACALGPTMGCGGEDDGSPPDPANQLRRALGLGAPGGEGNGLGQSGGTGDGLGQQGATGDGLGRSGSTGDGLGRPGGRADGIGDGPGARGSSTLVTPTTACAAACDAGIRCRRLAPQDLNQCTANCVESLRRLTDAADGLQSCAGQSCSVIEDCIERVIRESRPPRGDQPVPIESNSIDN